MEALAKFVEAIAQLIGVLTWPAVAVFFGLRFGQPIREFLTNLGEGSFKILGVEASGKRRAEAAAAIATATIARLDVKNTDGVAFESNNDRIAKLVSRSLHETNEIITRDALKFAADKTVMWVDDNPSNNIYEKNALEAIGIRVWTVTNTDKALELFKYGAVADVIISDMSRPEGPRAGYDLLAKLRDRKIFKPFIIYSSSNTASQIAEAKSKGAFGSTTDANELIALVLNAIKSPLSFEINHP